ncbi:MAG: DUF2911 domain-containing protein [Pyrinomonadaceae bacterium]
MIKTGFNFLVPICLILLIGLTTNYGQTGGVRASQKASVSQRIATTDVTVDYSRPSSKGRVLFGPDGIIKFGAIWMPGANEASFIKLTGDVYINDQLLRAGSYSIWTIPGKDEWTIILSRDWEQWHTQYPGEDEDAARFTVKPGSGSHTEMLTFYFPNVTSDSALLNLHWGTTIISLSMRLDKK